MNGEVSYPCKSLAKDYSLITPASISIGEAEFLRDTVFGWASPRPCLAPPGLNRQAKTLPGKSLTPHFKLCEG
jgi:hypothetical protein